MFMVGALLRFGSIAAWVFRIIACMGGCFGCDAKTKLTSKINESLKGQKNNYIHRTALSEDFWTTSTCDMDNNIMQSCESISSMSTLTQVHDTSGTGSSNKTSEFVNHGLIIWNQTRQKWIGDKKPRNRSKQLLEPMLSWDATYDTLLSNNKSFRRPVPLGEMIDFLVDTWEQEGLYSS